MRAAIFIFLLSNLFSCSLGRPSKEPEIYVSGFVFEEASLFETKARLSLRIENDNPYPLKISGGVHRFYINDVYLGKGYSQDSFEIPKFGSQKHIINVSIDNLTLFTKMQQLLLQPSVRFKVESTLYLGLFSSSHVQTVDMGIFDVRKPEDGLKRFRRRPETPPFPSRDDEDAFNPFID
jgi:LEA14-like dessication related protein